MSLDVCLYIDVDTGGKEKERIYLYESNITHNLGKMASKADIYKCLWSPEEIQCYKARDIIGQLSWGLKSLKDNPDYYRKFNSPNGWGTYKHFVPFVEKYLEACKKHPKAIIEVGK